MKPRQSFCRGFFLLITGVVIFEERLVSSIMKTTYKCLLLGLPLLASCTVSDNEQQGLDEVVQRYGGKVSFKIGTFTSTNPQGPQGKTLEIDLANADLTRYGRRFDLPASNSATLVYKHMTAAERADYDCLQVVLQQGDSSRTFVYKMPVLAQSEQAYSQLRVLLEGWKRHDYQAVADRWTQAALTRPDRTELPAAVARQGEKIGPIASFTPEGFLRSEVPVQGQTKQLMSVYVSIAAPSGATRQMSFVLDPQLKTSEQFLYGLEFLQPPFRSY